MITSTSSKAALGLLFLAAALRFFALGSGSIQIDEAMSVIGAAQWRHGFQDVHPPLYYALLELWAGLGLSEFWLRSSSVLASLLGLLLWLRLVRTWQPELVLVCGFMLATSFSDIQQAREVRMYAWLQLWALAYFVALHENRRALAALALLAAVFTHLFGLFLVPLGLLKGWSRWSLVVCSLWGAWGVPHYLGQSGHPLGLRQSPTLSMEVEAVGRLLGGRICAFGDPFSIGLGGLAIAWLLWRRPRCPRLVYAWALLPWLSVWLVSSLTSLQVFEFKYLIWTTPAWIYLLAAATPARPLALLWVVVNGWGLLPWLRHPHVWMADWRGAAMALRAGDQPIYVHPSMMAAPLFYYGFQAPRLKLIDEWPQLVPGSDMIWVTTPNHPYVAQQHLLDGVRKYWSQQRLQTFPGQLPSSQIDVSFWRWGQGPPPSKENQPR